MEELVEKFGWKKVAIVLIILSVIAIIYFTFSIFPTDKTVKNINPKKIVGNSENTNESINPEISSVPKNNSAEDLSKTYITPYYQISYPQSYEAELFEPSGELSALRISNKAQGVIIEVTVFDASKESINDFSKIFQEFGYTSSAIKISNMTGKSFEGVLKGTKLFEKIVLLQKGNTLIKIQLMQTNGPTEIIKQGFDDIVGSLN